MVSAVPEIVLPAEPPPATTCGFYEPFDGDLNRRLRAAGFRPFRAPGVRASVVDQECYEDLVCAHCGDSDPRAVGWMRPDGRYVVAVTCGQCGSQTAV